MGTGASKAAFRDVLSELSTRDISQDETAFWEQMWKSTTTPYVSEDKWTIEQLHYSDYRVLSGVYGTRPADPLMKRARQYSSAPLHVFAADLSVLSFAVGHCTV